MRRAFGVSAVFISIVSLVAFAVGVSAEQTAPNIWNANISVTDEGVITQSEATSGINCDIILAKARTLEGLATYNSAGFPRFLQPDVKQQDIGSICATRNSSGVFGGGKYYSPDQNPLDMLQLLPNSSTQVGYKAAPVNNVVVQSVAYAQGQTIGINYNFDAIGRLDVTKKAFLKYDFNWVIQNAAPQLRYTDGSNVLQNGLEFSRNGKYMVIRLGNSFVKVNVQTQEMTPFYYRSTVSNIFSMAISRDGRYVATNMNGEIFVHDTSGCAASYAKGLWPKPTQTAFAGCTKSTNYYSKLTQVAPGYGVVRKLEFSPNDASISLAFGREYQTNKFEWKKLRLTSLDYDSATEGYLAMGDSFSSGEGDLQGGDWYEPGTDEQGNIDTFENRNLCHLSRRSYPYLIAKQLGYLDGGLSSPTTPDDNGPFHSVACSGAVMHNIVGTTDGLFLEKGNEDKFKYRDNQYNNSYLAGLGRWQPGRTKQLDTLDSTNFGGYLSTEARPEAITIGIGGNDAGFGDTIKACTMPGTCKQAVAGSTDASNLAIRIMRLKPKLVETYNAVKSASPDSRIYVHGYPTFVQGYGGNCGLNVFLDANETALVEEGVKYMNQIVESAAKEAGVVYVDIENILDGINLCSGANDNSMSVNGVTAGNDIDFKLCLFRTGCLGKESFHPNPFAHERYSTRILDLTDDFSMDMPEPQTTNVPVPDVFFGTTAQNEAILSNNGGNYTLIVPEPKPFLNSSADGLKILQGDLLPGSSLRVELQSDPTTIAEFIVPQNGTVDKDITLPEIAVPGSHEIHLFGTTQSGQAVDFYEPIMLEFSETDFDGDGVANELDSCQTLINSFIDLDNDEIDDACDSEVVVPETPEIPQEDPEEDIPGVVPTDDGREKGQPNPETVAGSEDLSGVLGANTDTNVQPSDQSVLGAATSLQNTGSPIALFVIVGIWTVFSVFLVTRYWSRD